jgi:hypothetical protein
MEGQVPPSPDGRRGPLLHLQPVVHGGHKFVETLRCGRDATAQRSWRPRVSNYFSKRAQKDRQHEILVRVEGHTLDRRPSLASTWRQ